MAKSPEGVILANRSEEVLLNDRTTFRLRTNSAGVIEESSSRAALAELTSNPERFLDVAFVAVAPRLKGLVDQLVLQESALGAELRGSVGEGQRAWLVRSTQQECERLLAKFVAEISPFIPNAKGEAHGNATVGPDVELPGLTNGYRKLFGEARWFELVCRQLASKALVSLKKPAVVRMDVEVLGRSGLWHEIDLLVVTPDLSACIESKSGRWGRSDMLKLLAQREDIGADEAVMLTLLKASEDYQPVSRAHPLRTFQLQGAGVRAFEGWLAEAAGPA